MPDSNSDLQPETFSHIPYGEMLSNRYQVLDVIGSGGMGSVYRARDMHFPKATKIVAIKELLNSSSDAIVRDEVIQIFEREANILATLNHPSIPKIFDFFSEKNRVFLVLEYIEGGDLKSILNEYEGFIPLQQILRWTLEICEVLSYLHHHSPAPLIFRDLKPSNIMINQNNKVVLIDFGIAKALQATEKGTIVGTEGYSPPEQYRGEVSPAVDIYALGATLHYLVTRRDPQLETPFTFHERPIGKINPGVPEELIRFINTALAYQPEERFQSIEEVKDALLDCVKKNKIDINSNDSNKNILSQPVKSKLVWQFETGDEIRGTPRLENNLLLIGSYDQCLYAINANDGSYLWKFQTRGGIVSQPLVKDNMVFFGSEDTRLMAVSIRTGNLLWEYHTEDAVRSSPRTAEGHIFIGSDSGYLHAVNLVTTKMTWRTDLGSPIRSSPLLTKDGLFVGSDAGEMVLIDFGGKIQWRFYAKKGIIASPVAYRDSIVFPSLDGFFYSISKKNGWLQWDLRMGKGSVTTPFLVENLVIFGSADGKIYCVNLDTEKTIWKYDTGHQISGSPVCRAGKVYIGDSGGQMHCLSLKNGQRIWEFSAEGAITGAPVLGDGLVIFGATDQNIYALSID